MTLRACELFQIFANDSFLASTCQMHCNQTPEIKVAIIERLGNISFELSVMLVKLLLIN